MKWGDSIDDESKLIIFIKNKFKIINSISFKVKSERTDENGNKIIEEIIEKDGKKFKVELLKQITSTNQIINYLISGYKTNCHKNHKSS